MIPVSCVHANGFAIGVLKMLNRLSAPTTALIGAVLLAGCSADGTLLGSPITTGSINQPAIDPACVSLTAEIDGLMKEGVAEKVEKAAANKYRLKKADLAKVDRLNKANAEFQDRCALNPAKPAETTAAAGPAEGEKKEVAANSKPAEATKAPSQQAKTQ